VIDFSFQDTGSILEDDLLRRVTGEADSYLLFKWFIFSSARLDTVSCSEHQFVMTVSDGKLHIIKSELGSK
jgi:hypothetical protein